MSRSSGIRRFVRLAGCLGAVALTACSGAAPAASPTASKPATTAPVAASKSEPANPAAVPPVAENPPGQPTVQRLVMSLVGPGRESNDVRLDGNLDVWQHKPMYEYLIGYDPQTGKYIPQLATEWALEPDQLSFRMKLRPGVQFHKNMGEFTARDVVFTWQEMKKDDTLNGWVPWYQNTVTDIEVVNDHEVVFHLNREDSNFVNILSEADAGFEIRSKAHADAMGAPMMEGQPYAGTGPYQYKERVQAQYIRYERVPYQHWRVQTAYPEFEYRFQREASTRLAGLLAGELHLAQLPQDLLAEAEKKGFTSISSSLPGLRAFIQTYCCQVVDPADPTKGYQATGSPLLDGRVRMALNKAINRDELNKSLLAGKGERMMIQAHHPSRPAGTPVGSSAGRSSTATIQRLREPCWPRPDMGLESQCQPIFSWSHSRPFRPPRICWRRLPDTGEPLEFSRSFCRWILRRSGTRLGSGNTPTTSPCGRATARCTPPSTGSS